MTVNDRTTEFISAVDSLQSRGTGAMHTTQLINRLNNSSISSQSSQSSQNNNNNNYTKNKSEFTLKAINIKREFANINSKLDKLEKLAKKMSLFDDKPLEIQQLTLIVKQDISRLNADIQHLNSSYITSTSTNNNTRQLNEHAFNVVVSLQSTLAYSSNRFKNVLEQRTQNMKLQQARRDQFTPSSISSSSFSGSSHHHQSTTTTTNNTTNPLYIHDKQQRQDHVSIPIQPQLLLQQQDSNEYISGRAEAVEGIEKTITELASLFTQLTTMISAHDDMVRRIDYNMEAAETNVQGAQRQLMQLMGRVSSDRWLMARIFFILIFFFIIFALFFA